MRGKSSTSFKTINSKCYFFTHFLLHIENEERESDFIAVFNSVKRDIFHMKTKNSYLDGLTVRSYAGRCPVGKALYMQDQLFIMYYIIRCHVILMYKAVNTKQHSIR